jgi:hypothetical protein
LEKLEMKTKIQTIIEVLRENGIKEGNYFSKKAFLKILRRILLQEYNIQGLSTLYEYIQLLKLDGIIVETDDGYIVIKKLQV